MREFHATLRPFPEGVAEEIKATWNQLEVQALRVPTQANAMSFELSYEELSDRLNRIDRLHLEPDGSFVWVNAVDVKQRINGQITDNGKRVMFIEMRGCCVRSGMEPIVRQLGWPEVAVSFQLQPEALLVDGEQFLSLLG
jgi:hypothetical protein